MDRKRGFAVLPAKVSASKAHGSFLSVSFSSWTSQKWLLGLETHWSRPHPHQCQVMSPRSLALPPVCTRCHSAFLAPEHSASPPFILAASRVGTRHGRVCHDVLGCDTSQGEKVPVCRNGCQSLHPACPEWLSFAMCRSQLRPVSHTSPPSVLLFTLHSSFRKAGQKYHSVDGETDTASDDMNLP